MTGHRRGSGRPGPGWVTAEQVRRALGTPALRIAFLHGLQENARCWDQVTAALPDDVDAWVFGLPWDGAHGDAWAMEREPGVWIERALAQLPYRPDVLVAHSFGANALLDHLDATGTPDDLRLVLLAPFFRATRAEFDWRLLSYYLTDFHLFLAGGITSRRARTIDPDVLLGMSLKVRDRVGAYGWLRFMELFTRTPLLDLAGLTMPVAVVGGERDIASYPADCTALAAALPDATVEIVEGCGHHLMVEAPERVVRIVRELAERQDRAA
jgi:pimeloyl-ACP methyl ester carboxylesterase